MLKSLLVGNRPFSATGDYTDYAEYEYDEFYIQNCTGLEPPKNTINMMDINPYAGSYFSSARGQARNIVLTLALPSSLGSVMVESSRQFLYDAFVTAPGVPITLRFEIGNLGYPISESKFYYIDAYLESIENNRFGKDLTFTISLICPDPYFKYESKSISIPSGSSYASVSAMSPIPFGFYFEGTPTTTGSSGSSGALTIENSSSYSGTFTTYKLELLAKTGAIGTLSPRTKISTEIGNKYAKTVSYTAAQPGFDLMSNIRITKAWPLIYPGSNSLSFTLSGMTGASLVYSDRKAGLTL